MITVVFKPRTSKTSFSSLENPSQFFTNQVNYRLGNRSHTWQPPTDVYETDEKIIVLVEISGMREEDFSITIDQNILSIYGVRSLSVEEGSAIHQIEILYGEFFSEVEFPIPINIDLVEASYQKGILQIVIDKATPKKIQVTKD